MLRARTLGVLLVAAISIGAACAAACTLFDFPRPSDTPDAGPPGFLDVPTAGRFCSQLFRCPTLAPIITETLGLPLDVPSSPLGFSSCMDWVAGPVDPQRVGLVEQLMLLQAVADAKSCDAAAAVVPVQLVADAGTACPNGFMLDAFCLDPGTFAICDPKLGTFSTSCSSALFASTPQTCRTFDGGDPLVAGLCANTSGTCTVGKSCPDLAGTSTTLRTCYFDRVYTDYNCAISGRQCAQTQNSKSADCVVPPMGGPPCDGGSVDDCDLASVRHCSAITQTEFRCDAVGLTCSSANDGHVPRCAPDAGAACNPFDSQQNVCTGGAISVCIGGRPQSFDCTSINLQCVTEPSGSAQTAHCGP